MEKNSLKSTFHSISFLGEEFDSLTKKDLRDFNHASVNSHALQVTKYFKNQKPYFGTEPFTDELFPPNYNSLMGYDADGNPKDKIFLYNKTEDDFPKDLISWKRASEIFTTKFAIFEGSINSEDVMQGYLSNCYFLCCLTSLTNCPQAIIQNFRHLKVQDNGYYEICLKIDGVWQIVIVDDYFPMAKETEFVGVKPSGNEIWVMLLEKAWAKVNGGYNYINFGIAKDGYIALTNFYPDFFYCSTHISAIKSFNYYEKFLKNYDNNKNLTITNNEELIEACWQKLKFLHQNKAFFTAGSLQPKEEAVESINKNGIVTFHQYTITDLYERIVNGKNVRLIKLRNPWAKIEFTGKWSDNSEEWTDEARKEFNYYTSQDDGAFHMEISDFLNSFLYIEYAITIDPSCSKKIQIPKGYLNKVHAYDFTINKESLVNFNLIPKSRRFHKSIPNDPYQNIDFLIVKKEEDSLKFVYNYFNNPDEKKYDFFFNLEPGKYLIYLRFDSKNYNYDKERKINFNATCNNYFLFNLNSEEVNPRIFERINEENKILSLVDSNDDYLSNLFNQQLKIQTDNSYDYFFKNIKIDLNQIIEQIDVFKVNYDYMQLILPKHIYLFDKFAPLELEQYQEYKKTIKYILDHPSIKGFREVYLVGIHEIPTGRAVIHNSEEMGSIANDFIVTYLYDGKQYGKVISYVENIFSEYTACEYIKNGEGRIYLRNGRVKKTFWIDNQLSSEEYIDEENIYLKEYESKLFAEDIQESQENQD